jgi:hypothetical protein
METERLRAELARVKRGAKFRGMPLLTRCEVAGVKRACI